MPHMHALVHAEVFHLPNTLVGVENEKPVGLGSTLETEHLTGCCYLDASIGPPHVAGSVEQHQEEPN